MITSSSKESWGTNQLYDINWRALNYASRAPQLITLCVPVCIVVTLYVYNHAVHNICQFGWYQHGYIKEC